jgi:putative Holliday junction resolvase
LVTVSRDLGAAADSVPADMAELVRLVGEHEAVQIVVGLPVQLSGTEGAAAIDIRAYAERLARAVGHVPIVLADERMSTVVATRRLAERGVRGRRQRAVVDQAAAVEILQSWLDAQRRQTR